MKLLFIRHGEPDYAHDSLTEKGFCEAELLKEHLLAEHIDTVYLSPLGRAQRTAEPFLRASGKRCETLPWLREFVGNTQKPYENKEGTTRCPWNIPPEIWTKNPKHFSLSEWDRTPLYQNTDTASYYRMICRNMDRLLAEHGYARTGMYYSLVKDNASQKETIVFFCHLGVINAILSHLVNIPLPVFWHSFFLPPSSVTTVVMEHRVVNSPAAIPRIVQLGDVSHLRASGEPASTSGFFMDTYE